MTNILKLLQKQINVKEFIKEYKHLDFIVEGKTFSIRIAPEVDKSELDALVDILWEEKLEMTFHDTVYPSMSDPGAYFSYSTEKSDKTGIWSMTLGNHRWSGGIYHIRSTTISQQILNLVQKRRIDSLQLSDVAFFSHYPLKSAEDSKDKDKEILQLHQA
jgi:hypothetical protein